MRRFKRLLVAALALVPPLASTFGPVAAQPLDYSEPQYVAALMSDSPERLLSWRTSDWDLDSLRIIARSQELRNLGPAVSITMAQREFLGRHGLPATQIDNLLNAPAGAVKDTSQISVVPRKRILRALYLFGFAEVASKACAGFDHSTIENVSRFLKVSEGQGLGQHGPQDPMEQFARPLVRNAISRGRSDATRYFQQNPCTSAQAQKVVRHIAGFLSPGPSADTPEQAKQDRDALLKTTYGALLSGRYLIPRGLYDPLSYVAPTADERPAYRIPSAVEEAPGSRIGWHGADRDVLRASQKDGLLLMMAFVRPSQCADCATTLTEVLGSRQLNSLAGTFRAMLVVVGAGETADGARLATLFKIDRFPSLSLVKVSADGVDELARLVGPFKGQTLVERIRTHAPRARDATTVKDERYDFDTRGPAFCWRIESFEMCWERVKNGR